MNLVFANVVAGIVFVSALVAVLVYLPWRIRQSYRQTFIALARAVEAREPHLLGHAEQTSRYVMTMARLRGMGFVAMRTLEDATLLHGIGKVSVPYGLLNTPAPLSDPTDRFVLRDYVRVGAAILDVIPVLRPAADIIRFHHEYVDGSGYPFGRSGEAIPFEAQMLCIASEFAAMTAPRLYRGEAAFTPQQADNYVRAQAGVRYSRRAVSLFLKARTSEKLRVYLVAFARFLRTLPRPLPLPRRIF